MKALRATRAQKTLIDGGKWQTGKMPNKASPLSKGHSYRLGSGWEWCVFKVACEDKPCRILISFDLRKAQYLAWLGFEEGEDQALVARLEYHPTHNAWHCHLKPGSLTDIQRGVVKVPREKTALCSAPDEFHMSQNDAIRIAFRMFNVVRESVGLV